MGRRLNLAMPAMFVLFVFGLFYYTFGHDDDVAGRAGAGRWATTADEARAVPNRRLPDPELEVPAPNAQHAAPVVVTADSRIGVLMIACNRPEVQRALDSLLKARPSKRFPVVISQDCGDGRTAEVIDHYEDRIVHLEQPNLGPVHNVPPEHAGLANYYKISRHYKWALSQMFDVLMFDQVIIVEDDLDVAPDFFEYFEALLPILRSDPTLWCVSAWNDNGKAQFLGDPPRPEALRRTDFFPGLGWMLTREIWEELKPKWPAAFWDDWMRDAEQRKGRACIAPEVSRTFTFGVRGVSQGQYYNDHLAHIVLNQQFVPFTTMDLTFLYKDKYDEALLHEVYRVAKPIAAEALGSVARSTATPSSFRITYTTPDQFEPLARSLGLMSDRRGGVPRTAYLGIVTFRHGRHTVHLAPLEGQPHGY